ASTPLPLAVRIASSRLERSETSKISSLTFNSLPAISTPFICIRPVAGSHKTATLLSCGIASFSNSSHFLLNSGKSKNTPVTWPPGRQKLSITPLGHGVGLQIKGNDRNVGGRRSSSFHCRRANCDDHIYFAFHRVHRKRGNARGITVAGPKNQCDIVRLSVSDRL